MEQDFRERVDLHITEARKGYAKGEIVLRPWHMNVLGIVHGGVLFTLADCVSGSAAVAEQAYSVPTINANIQYLRPGKDTEKLIAEAVETKNGQNFSVVECKIMDDRQRVLATTTMTYFHKYDDFSKSPVHGD